MPVEVLTVKEIKETLDRNPFGYIDIDSEGTKVLVTFLSTKPAASKVDEIQQFVITPEKLVVHNRKIYLYCPHGYGNSKLSNTFIERVVATTRNWKTVTKLYELSAS